MTMNPTSVDPDVPTEPAIGPPAGPGRRLFRGAREIVVIVAIALVASALMRAFVVQAFYVPTGSMLPAIQLHDKILVSRIGGIHRGEVVVFRDPGGWIAPDEKSGAPGPLRAGLEFVGVLPQSSDDHLVKRVVGLPGDHVVCCSTAGLLRINGKPIEESSYLFQGGRPRTTWCSTSSSPPGTSSCSVTTATTPVTPRGTSRRRMPSCPRAWSRGGRWR